MARNREGLDRESSGKREARVCRKSRRLVIADLLPMILDMPGGLNRWSRLVQLKRSFRALTNRRVWPTSETTERERSRMWLRGGSWRPWKWWRRPSRCFTHSRRQIVLSGGFVLACSTLESGPLTFAAGAGGVRPASLADNPYVQEGEFLELERPSKLVHTWDSPSASALPSTPPPVR